MRAASACAVLALIAGCGDPGGDAPADAGPEVFIALDRDFADYRSWPSVEITSAPDELGHRAPSRTVYVHHLPEEGARVWPVGALIVKESLPDGVLEVHAMAKRGGAFNVDGAYQWEWFELGLDGDTPVIRLRGADLENYRCAAPPCEPAVGDCNSCHAIAASFDYVMSEPLRLGAVHDTFAGAR